MTELPRWNEVIVANPRGFETGPGHPYPQVIVQRHRDGLRFQRVTSYEAVKAINVQWARGDYSKWPGEIRKY